jgi:hypothetical protein
MQIRIREVAMVAIMEEEAIVVQEELVVEATAILLLQQKRLRENLMTNLGSMEQNNKRKVITQTVTKFNKKRGQKPS